MPPSYPFAMQTPGKWLTVNIVNLFFCSFRFGLLYQGFHGSIYLKFSFIYK